MILMNFKINNLITLPLAYINLLNYYCYCFNIYHENNIVPIQKKYELHFFY